jgi:hypothetical protein
MLLPLVAQARVQSGTQALIFIDIPRISHQGKIQAAHVR